MKIRVDKGSILEQRVLSRLNYIKKLVETNPHAGLTLDTSTRECYQALKSLGILINYGTNKKPIYSWQDGVAVTEKLVNEVVNIIRINTSIKNNKTRKKKEARMNIEDKKDTIKTVKNEPLDLFVADSTVMPTFSISDVSSQELWDELKGRGFKIVDNTLQKVEITTLL